MRVLLTGITGFAGGHLAELLVSQSEAVFGVTRSRQADAAGVLGHLSPSITLLTVDLCDAAAVSDLLHDTQPTAIFHLAAQAFVPTAWADPWATIQNNVQAQLNILQAMVEQKSTARLLVIASDQVYGLIRPTDLPVDEQTPLCPTNPYGVSKVTQDMLGLQYHHSHQLDVVRVRPFNHFGPRQEASFVAANFAKQIADIEAQQHEPVIYVGNLEAQRDFTDVRDVVRAYLLLMQQGKSGEVYNVGSGQARSIRYLLEVLLSFSTCDITIKQDPSRMRPSDVPVTYADTRKLQADTGWQPTHTFENSLRDVLDYWRQQVQKS